MTLEQRLLENWREDLAYRVFKAAYGVRSVDDPEWTTSWPEALIVEHVRRADAAYDRLRSFYPTTPCKLDAVRLYRDSMKDPKFRGEALVGRIRFRHFSTVRGDD